MKNLLACIVLLGLSFNIFAVIPGHYTCPVEFDNGAFESLEFEFSNKIENPVLLHNASQTTPNFMLINLENEYDQTSVRFTNDSSESFKINWENTWYFGSSLSLRIVKNTKTGFQAEIEFDDNDGLSEVQSSMCYRKNNSATEK